jgi:hypothetical protein
MLFVAFGVVKGIMHYNAKQKVDELILPLKSFLHVEYSGISTSLMGAIGVKGLRLTSFNGDEVLTFGKVVLSSFEKDEIEQIPSNFSISLENVQFDTSYLNEVTPKDIPAIVTELGYGDLYQFSNNLEKLGYDKITADINFKFLYKRELGGVKLHLRENIRQLGEIDILLDVIGFVPGMRAMSADLKIKKLSIMFDDDSYTDRILKRFADKDSKTVNEYRIEIVEQLKNYLVINKVALEDSDIKALKKFLNNPNKLIVKISPPEPVSVDNLKFYKRKDVPKILNLKISAE